MKPDCRRLPRTARIRDDGTVRALLAARRVHGNWFVVRWIRTDLGHARMLVRVAKKVIKSAVGRNRIRRCVREVFRHQRGTLASFDYFVSLVRPYRLDAPLLEVRQELERLFRISEQR